MIISLPLRCSNNHQVLHAKHKIDIPDEVNIKKDAADLPLLFSDIVDVNFKKNGDITTERGRWCTICK